MKKRNGLADNRERGGGWEGEIEVRPKPMVVKDQPKRKKERRNEGVGEEQERGEYDA